MCGRFVQSSDVETLQKHFPIDTSHVDVTPSYNVAPTQPVLAVARHDGLNHLVTFHWGLVPFWAEAVSIGAKMINARAETVASRPGFRKAFKKRRCLIPADGFFEWTGAKGQQQPVYLTEPNRRPLAFAGLWETWDHKGAADTRYKSCAIITTRASASMQKIHHRMPVILKPEAYDLWLDPQAQDITPLQELIRNQILTELVSIPVSRRVNSVKHNGPENIAPIDRD